MTLAPIRPITLAEIEAAQTRIAGTVLRTPLVKLDLGAGRAGADLRPLRKPAADQPLLQDPWRGQCRGDAERSRQKARRNLDDQRGQCRPGRGVRAARAAGVPCRIVVIDTAPQTKIDRMRAFGAELLLTPFDLCWRALEEHAFPGMDNWCIPSTITTSLPATAAWRWRSRRLPGRPQRDLRHWRRRLAHRPRQRAWAKAPHVKVLGAEPETAAPLSLSLAAGRAQEFTRWQRSFVDGAGGRSVIPRMWQRMQPGRMATSSSRSRTRAVPCA